MDFGKLPTSQLDTIDFGLRADNSFNVRVLDNKTNRTPKVFVGCPVWQNKQWLGKIYPHKAKEKDTLGLYTRQFNTIELNVTHYQIPSTETINRWQAEAAEGFVFCPKFPQIISHEKLLQGTESLTENFCQQILGLGQNLGLPFLQLSPAFGPKLLPVLRNYLESLPKNLKIAVEFRNVEWFTDDKIWQNALALLQHHQMATVITDVAGRRDVLHQSLSVPILALRWVGNNYPSDYLRIDQWIQKLKVWLSQGLNEFYLFVHVDDNNTAPELATYWIKQLNLHCGLAIKEPQFLPKIVQTSLF